jgi:DNA-binding transcriptional LysR family regulator
MRAAMDWGDLAYLLAVARTGTHAAAARILGVDSTTVGRRLAALESAMGARLLQRTPSGWVPTDSGAELVRRAERIESDLAAAEVTVRGADRRASGLVRISGGDGILHYLLAPALPALRERHPDLVVELRPETRLVDLARREADVAIRLSRETSRATVSRRVAPLAMGIYAGRPLLARCPAPATLRDLASLPWLDYDASLSRAPQNRWLRATLPTSPTVVFRATTTTGLVHACAAGLGAAILPARVADPLPDLVRVVARRAPPPRDAFIVYREELRRRAAIAAVVDWLARVLA